MKEYVCKVIVVDKVNVVFEEKVRGLEENYGKVLILFFDFDMKYEWVIVFF